MIAKALNYSLLLPLLSSLMFSAIISTPLETSADEVAQDNEDAKGKTKQELELRSGGRETPVVFNLFQSTSDLNCSQASQLETQLTQAQRRLQAVPSESTSVIELLQGEIRTIKKRLETANWYCSRNKPLKPDNQQGFW